MTIPTDATHEVSIHDLDHEARAHLYNARQSRDEYLDELEEIRSLLGAGPGVTALEAVTFLVKDTSKEIAEERAAASVLRVERDAARGESNSDFVRDVAGVLGAASSEITLDAARRVVGERNDARAKAENLKVVIDEARKALGARDGQSLVEMVKLFVRERDEAIRERNEARAMLSIERDITRELRATLKIPNGVSLTETVKRLVEERADDRSEYADLRLELFANREESAIDAARRMAAENNSLTDRLRVAGKEREDMRQGRDAARIDADQYRGWLDAARERVAELESAIRDLAKVLP